MTCEAKRDSFHSDCQELRRRTGQWNGSSLKRVKRNWKEQGRHLKRPCTLYAATIRLRREAAMLRESSDSFGLTTILTRMI